MHVTYAPYLEDFWFLQIFVHVTYVGLQIVASPVDLDTDIVKSLPFTTEVGSGLKFLENRKKYNSASSVKTEGYLSS